MVSFFLNISDRTEAGLQRLLAVQGRWWAHGILFQVTPFRTRGYWIGKVNVRLGHAIPQCCVLRRRLVHYLRARICTALWWRCCCEFTSHGTWDSGSVGSLLHLSSKHA